MKQKFLKQDGQATVEYALILASVAIITVATLALLGPQIGNAFLRVKDAILTNSASKPESIVSTLSDFIERIQNFYEEHEQYPRSWFPYNFTDLGLDPDDWDEPVEGIYWKPHGADVGLANRAGDNLQIYVNDLEGNRLHLYDGWNIWCVAGDGQCYYHTVAPGNEIDINTLTVLEE